MQPWVGALTWTYRTDFGLWQGLTGGRSKPFRFPEIKGKKEGDLKTEKGGEGHRLMAG